VLPGAVDTNKTEEIQDVLRTAFKTAFITQENTDLAVQLASLLRATNLTKLEMEEFFKVSLPERFFTKIGHHITQHGAGVAVPAGKPAPRSANRRIEVVKKFVDFLLTSSILTANTRRVKNGKSEVRLCHCRVYVYVYVNVYVYVYIDI
jgi:hypothetical protein